MKKNRVLALLGGALFAAVVTVCALGVKASTLSDLSAKAGDYCKDCGSCSTDCRSGATGNIYPHHEAADF